LWIILCFRRKERKRHLAPKFGRMRLADVDLGAVMEWIDEQRAAGELSDASIRHNMNLLSRFFSWAIARGHAPINPVRQIPMGSRPTQTVKSDTPWLADDAIVRKLIADLEEPINFMFYLCNRSGLRAGKLPGCGCPTWVRPRGHQAATRAPPSVMNETTCARTASSVRAWETSSASSARTRNSRSPRTAKRTCMPTAMVARR
jgi:hypothetical protein